MANIHGRGIDVDAEALLGESRWVRALAKKLVGDAARADDVVQETWLAALRRGPEEEGALRPWLVRVATNFARDLKRRDAHRSAREARAARTEREPSTSETIERLELHRMLLEALEALSEPYRTTVRLRYFDGLSAAQIARRTGVPAGTVRWRLKHAIDLLRERLDHRHGGDRRAWCVALLPLIQCPNPSAVSAAPAVSLTSGVWIMSTMMKATVAAALALTATLVVWSVTRDDESIAPPRLDPPAAPSTAMSSERPSRLEAVESTGAAATARDVVPAAAPETERPVAPPAPSATRVHARFVDTSARALAGVRFTYRGFEQGEKDVASDANGEAVIDVEVEADAWPASVVAAVDGHATWFKKVIMKHDETLDLGEVVLDVGGSVAGVVVGADGAPIADAEVIVTRPEVEYARSFEDARRLGPETPEDGTPSATTSRDGKFRVDGVPAKVVRVWASARGMRYSVTPPFELEPRRVHSGITLTLAPFADEDTISGIVVTPDGAPIPDARMTYSYRSPTESGTSMFHAGPDGRFSVTLLKVVPHDFSARDEHGRWPDVGELAVQPGTHDLVLAFRTARSFELAVTRDGGTPVERFSARIWSADERRQIGKHDAEDAARGRARIDAPNEPFVVLVSAEGTTLERAGPFDPDRVPEVVRCRLASLPGVQGHVIHDGRPIAHATVSLYREANSDERIVHNGYLTRLRPDLVEADVSDDDGHFWLTVRDAGVYSILCDAEGYATTEVSRIDVDPAVGVSGLEISMSGGGAIEGRVLVAKDRDPAGTLVAINRFDARPRIVRVGSDGSFRFDGLVPGAWEVLRAERERSPNSTSTSSRSGDGVEVRYEADCEVHDGRTTRYDLDLSDLLPVLLSASVSVDKKPALGWTAQALRDEAENPHAPSARAAVDTNGRMSIELPDPATYRVTLRAPAELASGLVIETDLALARGDNPWVVELETAAIEGTLARPGEGVRLEYRWSADGLRASIPITVASDGRFRAPIVLAGHAELVTWREGDEAAAARIAVDVARGETRSVQVP